MTRHNRVLPTGEIVAAPFRGSLMGNRGILHDGSGRLGAARWRHPHWVTCVLSFKGRHRAVMSPGRYTELFFADEAVALAAGHRPCAECRRADYDRFRQAWGRAAGIAAPGAGEMDRVLHAARVDSRSRRHRTFGARLGEMPDGAFVTEAGAPLLVWDGGLHPWAEGRYGAPRPLDPARSVAVLTPAPTVAALRAGYRPMPGF